MTNAYITIEALKVHLERSDIQNDDKLQSFCVNASRLFDRFTRRWFYPQIETVYYDHPGQYNPSFEVDSLRSTVAPYIPSNSELQLRRDLLELTTLTTKNGTITITSADYHLLKGRSYNGTPYSRIVLDPNGTYTVFEYVNTPMKANAVTGIWGHHDDWSNAWRDSGDAVLDGSGINATVTTVTVTNASLFETLQTIRIDSEYMYITARDESAETLTVQRAVNGSTAATHALAVQIDIFDPMPLVVETLYQWGTYLVKLKNSPFGVGGTDRIGQTQIASLLGSDLTKLAKTYRYEVI